MWWLAALASPLPAATVLERYRVALAALHRPAAVTCDYSLSQLGLHNMEQDHRIYRSGTNERDETLVVDGYKLKAPSVRIFTGRHERYDIASVAPREIAYRFGTVVSLRVPGGYRYRVAVQPRSPQAFTIREIELDEHTYLPTIIRFRATQTGATGDGELEYGAADAYWVIRSARVVARLPDGKTARERITWSHYGFPKSLPSETFRAPVPRPKIVE